MQNAKPRFPLDIHLKSNSLAEAWLEIQWELKQGEQPNLVQDAGYAFALGAFYEGVRGKFPFIENLEASQVPFELPHVVRHRFREAAGAWPIIQIGPGVASVNFTTPYSWNDLRDLAFFLADKLLAAYASHEFKIQLVALRYRNAAPFAYSSNDLLGFLHDNLNVTLRLPNIPGYVGSKDMPTGANISLTFDLATPKGTGVVQFATGTSPTSGEVIVWDLSVTSDNTNVPDLRNNHEFGRWLDGAHAVIHEWFFSLVEGPLLQKFHEAKE